jgi:predicted AlkP superfamily phosphohydrolase/phosphomutase
MTGERNKLLIVGWDGATFDITQPMAARGELPVLARLLAEGAWGPLHSTVPPVSPQAWSSFLTGVHPGQHGVLGFLGAPEGRFYRRPILSARDIQAPTLLQIAGEAGRRVAAFGVPMTYPPTPVNGIVVPEQHGPPLSHPPGSWDEMVTAVGDPRDPATHVPYLFTQDKRGYVARQRELLEIQRQAAHWLLDRESYDLSIVVFTASDRASHFLWKYMDPTHPDHQPQWSEALGDALPDLYRRLDAILGELWERLDPDGTLMVMSDHGFGPLHKRVFANHLLRERGLLAVRPLVYRAASVRYPWPLLRLFNGAARRLGLPHMALPIGRWQEPIDPQLYDPRIFFDTHLLIDWARTRVYSGNSAEQGLFVNLRGREPSGIVEPGAEYEALRQELRQMLMAITDPDDGQPVMNHIWFREELYSGPWLERAPDLVVQLRNRYVLSPEFYVSDVVSPSLHISGTHRPQGICLLAGPSIQTGASLDHASIADLAPTALQLLGVPVPAHMEGRVLEEAFAAEWMAAHPVRRTAFSGEVAAGTGSELSEEEVAAMEAHLRGLGYIA